MRVKVNDISINYELAGRGTTLVLTHGLGGDTGSWKTVVPILSRHYRVLTWDMRGFGQSDKPTGDYSAGLLASDLAGLLQKLEIQGAFVLGHSMGGVIALRFVLDFSDLCQAVIVSASSAEVNPQATKYWQDLAGTILKGGLSDIPIEPARLFSRGFAQRNPDALKEWAIKRPMNDPMACAQAAIAMSSYDYSQELGDIRCPTLIMVGDQDVLTPPGGSVRMSRLIPNSKLIIFKDVGHVSYVEQPEVFSHTVLEFLAGVNER